MIDVKELRIGNLVYHAGEAVPVYQLDAGGITFCRINDLNINKKTGAEAHTHEVYYSPIPLSPEWLERLGFERKEWKESEGNGATFNKGDFFIEYNMGTNRVAVVFQKVMPKHVHQLQNLYFALTGQELTIKEQTPKKR